LTLCENGAFRARDVWNAPFQTRKVTDRVVLTLQRSG
jgi:hypothetical protein